MKTKNNVQKATTKLFALGLILVVMSVSVNAQNVGKSLGEAVGFKEIALAMVENIMEPNSLPTEADVYASYFVVETEEALELENWMTDEAKFDVYLQYFQKEQEEALEVEEWMIEESNFYHLPFQFTIETESHLELEDWMIADEVWNP